MRENKMKEIKTIVYDFDELSESAKQKALNELYDINVNDGWWDFDYEDAENIGVKIIGFDIGRGNYCNGKMNLTLQDSIEKVLSEHGATCETYKTALEYKTKIDRLEENDDFDDKLQEIEEEYLKDMLENYLVILRNEYEYQTSEERIKETIKANEYTFTADGELKNFRMYQF
jgi:hypothetical protein